jgi:hypothetical protein
MGQSATIVINRPTSEVFDYVMQVPNDAEWRTGVVEASFTSEGPLGVGSTGFDRIEFNDRSMVQTWTVFEYRPGVFAKWTLDSGPFRGSGGYVCERYGDGARFTLEAHVKPAGWYQLLGPIFGVIARRQSLADVRRLKTLLEAMP